MTDNARIDEDAKHISWNDLRAAIGRNGDPIDFTGLEVWNAVCSILAARRSIQEQPEVDRVAWLIECKTPEGARWYFEDATGWHSWTPDAHLATSFKTKAEAEKFPAYVMIKTDPNISLTEHVFLEQWKHEPEAETETANNVDDQGRAAPIFDRPAVHGETVGRDAAPPPIAGAGWKPIDTQLRAIMDDLGRTVADPMWADHVELRKSTLRGWIKQIRTALRAPSTKEPMVLIGGQSLVHIAELADMLRNLEIGKHVPVSSQFHEVAMVLGAIAASPVPDNTDARGAIGGTVAIKPLEWSELENGDFVAETIGEDYRVQAGIWASGWYWTKGEMASSAYPFFDEADEAKAAAQADYASRILSAIIPGTDASGVVEAAREICEYMDDGGLIGGVDVLPLRDALYKFDAALDPVKAQKP